MNHSIRQILFATDFSEGAATALNHALYWAKHLGARLIVLHVIEFQPGLDTEQPVNKMYLDYLRAQADEQLSGAVKAAEDAGVRGDPRTALGIPSQRINDAAREAEADLVVLGTRGLSGLEHLLLGSTAERVVRGAPCPVLVVHIPHQLAHAEDLQVTKAPVAVQEILAPIDFSDCSLEALEYAILLATAYQASLTILHVPEPISFGIDFTLRQAEKRRDMRSHVETWLKEVTELVRGRGLRVNYKLLSGYPADSIVTHTRAHRCDLIVMGTHGRRGFSHAICGSVAEAVLRHALCPVLTVKSPRFAPDHRRVLLEHRERLAALALNEGET